MTRRTIPGHVLVVGAGGIGCPALRGLAHAAVERVTVVDLDRVETSNLPRQVLFDAADVGQPKAPTAARALAGASGQITGVHARLDDTNVGELSQGVDVVIDATDGARTKDWLNHAAIHAGIPLVHAAGLRSEARMLVVPAAGRPCLSCLFGRLEDETGSCADLGVWNGVVGVIGFLAADAAVRVLKGDVPPPRYDVLDFDAGRALSLEASADAGCPVCHERPRALEAFPEAVACAAPTTTRSAADVEPSFVLDLREVRCPMNLLRARQALSEAAIGDVLEFQLGEEGAATVPDGVRLLGHEILHDERQGAGRLFRVRVAEVTSDFGALPRAQLERFARQLVLPDLGLEGQRRLADAAVQVVGAGVERDVAMRYLQCAGVGTVWSNDGDSLSVTVDGVTWRPVRDEDGVRIATEGAPADGSLALAALLADRVQRHIVDPTDTRPSLTLR